MAKIWGNKNLRRISGNSINNHNPIIGWRMMEMEIGIIDDGNE